MDFPTIHTNFWDAVISVHLVVILTQILKWIFTISKPLVPTIANALDELFRFSLHIVISYGQDSLWVFFTEMPLLEYMHL